MNLIIPYFTSVVHLDAKCYAKNVKFITYFKAMDKNRSVYWLLVCKLESLVAKSVKGGAEILTVGERLEGHGFLLAHPP